ncbi:MAG: hypothetical protein Q8O13_02415 [Candidatus Omnitrophota bacterium]|nr:hypothetical protein [Candidatus Omnitrophota bacterium]
MRRAFIVIMVLAFIFTFAQKGFTDSQEEIQALKHQVKELMTRIEKLEQDQAKSKEVVAATKEDVTKVKDAASRVDLSNALSKLKLKGRWAAGYYASGKAGSYPDGSFEIPEGKIQFAFEPDKINTIVMRFNVNNATAQVPLMDYFYLQSKDFLPFLKDTPFSLNSRLGRFKLGFGEETWSDNPVESILPSNSAAKTGASDEGFELAGKIKLDKIRLKPLGWVVSMSDGNSGVGSDSGAAKAFMGKFNYSPIDPLYLSFSYYDSGDLKISNSEFSIAGLVSRPTGATNWERRVWEFDARYDFGKGKKPLDPPVYSDSKAIVRLSYGQFLDDIDKSTGSPKERNGDFAFVDGIYNFNKKIYGAGRISFVELDDNVTASLNSVTTSLYDRFSFGGGYRWSDNTIIKLSYDINKNTGVSTEDADDNLLSAIVATQF